MTSGMTKPERVISDKVFKSMKRYLTITHECPDAGIVITEVRQEIPKAPEDIIISEYLDRREHFEGETVRQRMEEQGTADEDEPLDDYIGEAS